MMGNLYNLTGGIMSGNLTIIRVRRLTTLTFVTERLIPLIDIQMSRVQP